MERFFLSLGVSIHATPKYVVFAESLVVRQLSYPRRVDIHEIGLGRESLFMKDFKHDVWIMS